MPDGLIGSLAFIPKKILCGQNVSVWQGLIGHIVENGFHARHTLSPVCRWNKFNANFIFLSTWITQKLFGYSIEILIFFSD